MGRIARAGSGARNFLGRSADQADRRRRSARHANPFCAPSSCAVPLATAPRRRRGLGRRPLERRVSRRLAPGREVRGALIGFYLAIGDRALQDALRATPQDRCGIGRGGPSNHRDPADNPELVLQKKNQAELVRHSLARLSPEHGEVIDLVYYHGKSVREVAEIVGVAEATVKTRMFYARRRLAS